MLKGCLKCSDINKMLLRYIHFELPKKDMSKVALHLRNCPVCMEKYATIQRRKKELKQKMANIEKDLRMQNEISSYIDNEASTNTIFIVEGMLLCDEKYRKELIENERLREILQKSKKELIKNLRPKQTFKLLAKNKLRNKKLKKFLGAILPLFQYLHHVIVKSV